MKKSILHRISIHQYFNRWDSDIFNGTHKVVQELGIDTGDQQDHAYNQQACEVLWMEGILHQLGTIGNCETL